MNDHVTQNKFNCLRSRLQELLADVTRAEKERDYYRKKTTRLEDRLLSLEGEVYLQGGTVAGGSRRGSVGSIHREGSLSCASAAALEDRVGILEEHVQGWRGGGGGAWWPRRASSPSSLPDSELVHGDDNAPGPSPAPVFPKLSPPLSRASSVASPMAAVGASTGPAWVGAGVGMASSPTSRDAHSTHGHREMLRRVSQQPQQQRQLHHQSPVRNVPEDIDAAAAAGIAEGVGSKVVKEVDEVVNVSVIMRPVGHMDPLPLPSTPIDPPPRPGTPLEATHILDNLRWLAGVVHAHGGPPFAYPALRHIMVSGGGDEGMFVDARVGSTNAAAATATSSAVAAVLVGKSPAPHPSAPPLGVGSSPMHAMGLALLASPPLSPSPPRRGRRVVNDNTVSPPGTYGGGEPCRSGSGGGGAGSCRAPLTTDQIIQHCAADHNSPLDIHMDAPLAVSMSLVSLSGHSTSMSRSMARTTDGAPVLPDRGSSETTVGNADDVGGLPGDAPVVVGLELVPQRAPPPPPPPPRSAQSPMHPGAKTVRIDTAVIDEGVPASASRGDTAHHGGDEVAAAAAAAAATTTPRGILRAPSVDRAPGPASPQGERGEGRGGLSRYRVQKSDGVEEPRDNDDRDAQLASLRRILDAARTHSASRDAEARALRLEVEALLAKAADAASDPLRDSEMARLRRELLDARQHATAVEDGSLALRQRADADRGELMRLRERLTTAQVAAEAAVTQPHSDHDSSLTPPSPLSPNETHRLRCEAADAASRAAAHEQRARDLEHALEGANAANTAHIQEVEALRRTLSERDTALQRALDAAAAAEAECAAARGAGDRLQRDLEAEQAEGAHLRERLDGQDGAARQSAGELAAARGQIARQEKSLADAKRVVERVTADAVGTGEEVARLRAQVKEGQTRSGALARDIEELRVKLQYKDEEHVTMRTRLEEDADVERARAAEAAEAAAAAADAARNWEARAAAAALEVVEVRRGVSQRRTAAGDSDAVAKLKANAADALRKEEEWARRAEAAAKEAADLRRAVAAHKATAAAAQEHADALAAEGVQLRQELAAAKADAAGLESTFRRDADARAEAAEAAADDAAARAAMCEAQLRDVVKEHARCEAMQRELAAANETAAALRKRVVVLEKEAFGRGREGGDRGGTPGAGSSGMRHPLPQTGGRGAADGGLGLDDPAAVADTALSHLAALRSHIAHAIASWDDPRGRRDTDEFHAAHRRALGTMLRSLAGVPKAKTPQRRPPPADTCDKCVGPEDDVATGAGDDPSPSKGHAATPEAAAGHGGVDAVPVGDSSSSGARAARERVERLCLEKIRAQDATIAQLRRELRAARGELEVAVASEKRQRACVAHLNTELRASTSAKATLVHQLNLATHAERVHESTKSTIDATRLLADYTTPDARAKTRSEAGTSGVGDVSMLQTLLSTTPARDMYLY